MSWHGLWSQGFLTITAWLLIIIMCRHTLTHRHTPPCRCCFFFFFILFKKKKKELGSFKVTHCLLRRKAEVMNVSLIYLRCYTLWMKGFYATRLWKLSAYGNSEKKENYFKWVFPVWKKDYDDALSISNCSFWKSHDHNHSNENTISNSLFLHHLAWNSTYFWLHLHFWLILWMQEMHNHDI